MEVNSIAQILCAKLILMEDPDKAAKFLYDLVDIKMSSEKKEKEVMREFVLTIIKNVIIYDQEYADDMAKKYLLHIVESTARP
jgi:hypothetical protein